MDMSTFDLSGRVAIVTGGGMGIGQRLALGLAEHGASVVVADIAVAGAEETAGKIESAGGRAIAVSADATNQDSVQQMVDTAVSHFGTVDIMVNNAGGGRGAPTKDLSLEDWHFTLDLCATSAFLCSQRAGRVMIEKGGGKIINVASVYGLVGQDSSLYDLGPDGELRESLAYAAGKGAIVNMTRSLAVYWARYKINVNAIAPGMIRTERLAQTMTGDAWDNLSRRTPLKRPGTPEDMQGAVIFLASPASDFVTGQTLAVDGGWVAW